MRLSAGLLWTLALCAAAHAQQEPARSVGDLISGQATTVVDGVNFRIVHDRIRLWGIDAPAWKVRCTVNGKKWSAGRDSHHALTECMRGTTVTCRVQKVVPRFARPQFIAECWRDDNKDDIAACMVRSGYATDWPGYSGGHYAELEEEPRSLARGLWQCAGGPPTRRWCRRGPGSPCEQPIYKPQGP
jgi:endonuclease YncB( thermonuclease family)